MNKIPAFLLLLMFHTAFTQEIPRMEADSMLMLLNNTSSGIGRIELLLNLAQFHILKPGENKIDLDSAEAYINEAKAFYKKVNSRDATGYILLTESRLVKERGQKISVPPYFKSEESKKMVEKVIDILESGSNKDYLGQAYYELAQYYDDYDSLQALKKMKLLEQSANVFQQAGDLKRKGQSLEVLGNLYYNWGEPDKSDQMLKEALTSYNTINYPKLQGVYRLIGRAYYYKHDLAPALSYLLKALRIARAFGDSSRQLCEINNYLGLFYSDIDRMDVAIKYFNDALEIAGRNHDENEIYGAVINLSYGYNNTGQMGQSLKVLDSLPKRYVSTDDFDVRLSIAFAYFRAYMGLLQLNKAKPFCDVLVRIADNKLKQSEYNMKALIYMSVARFYFLYGHYGKARFYLTKSNAIANKFNYDFVQVRNLELSYKLDSAEGNLKSAFNCLLQYKAIKDSVSGVNKTRQFQVMNVEYEVEMKEDSIKLKDKDILLLTQKNSLQQANLKQAGFVKNITIAGIILSFFIISLLYRQYRHKQKSSQLISQKNKQLQHLLTEKEWLVKEIHHRVKNNFQTVMGLLGTQSAYLKTGEAINAVNESQQRIQAMSLIHQRLYQSNNLSAIKMTDYIYELADSLKHSFNAGRQIHFKLDIEPVELDLAHCIPLGLIMNEAITNSFKYAFIESERGDISISLIEKAKNNFSLTVRDNGIGLPPEFDMSRSHSMGMNLMRGLSAELGGRFAISNENGTCINVNFTYAHNTAMEFAPAKTTVI